MYLLWTYMYIGVQLQKIVPYIVIEYTSIPTSLLFVIRLQKSIHYNTFELFLSSNIASIFFSEVFFLVHTEKRKKRNEKAAKALLSDKLSFILFKTLSSTLRCLAFLYQ